MDENIKCTLHEAIRVVDDHGFIYAGDVVDLVSEGMVVRIFISIEGDAELSYPMWLYDCFYVRVAGVAIVSTAATPATGTSGAGRQLLGVALDIGRRHSSDTQYPVNTGDHVWFGREHIIEIPRQPRRQQSQEVCEMLQKKITSARVPCTGPLFTIKHNYREEAATDGDEESAGSYSDTDTASASS